MQNIRKATNLNLADRVQMKFPFITDLSVGVSDRTVDIYNVIQQSNHDFISTSDLSQLTGFLTSYFLT